jgi:hypothetical protein
VVNIHENIVKIQSTDHPITGGGGIFTSQEKGKRSMTFVKMSPGIFPHTSGREEG